MKNNVELLKEDSKVSSMRWALMQVVRMCYLLVACAGAYIVITSLKGSEINWNGIAILLLSLTGFIGAAVTGKWAQKKDELKA